ncbi:phospholipase/carboxylesterase [Mariprofundus ferrinatatus]|uniref:Phospholipase/carboxylesterase n=1 Tax=Mariprofundus ferrinatatus TaxID=1921087 RepID=A0A2K8L8U0_9PROT|nr:dienelactone hydrolase family protein [Mariprofundus ferrinatatus]ATX82679.1 phospholipase/carboxylesterase [Mariprofundus ferrinatatus]
MVLHTLPHIKVETGPSPDAAVIWLHGLGADGHDFEPIVPQLGLPADLAVRFIFPHAPSMPVTLNGGYIMPAWYDIKQTDLGIEHDREGIKASTADIRMLIEREQVRGIKASRIILAGFSQGAAMSLHVGLRQSEPLAGIMALSGYLLLPHEIEKLKPEAISTPIFMAHGIHDPVVSYTLGDNSRRKLAAAGCKIEWHSYPMQHSVCLDEIKQIGKWITTILRPA